MIDTPKFKMHDRVYFINKRTAMLDKGRIEVIKLWNDLMYSYEVSGERSEWAYFEDELFLKPKDLLKDIKEDIAKLQEDYDLWKKLK